MSRKNCAQEWRENAAKHVTCATPQAYGFAMPTKSAAAASTTKARKPRKVAARSRVRTPIVELEFKDLHDALKPEVLKLADGDKSRVRVISRTEAIISNH